MIKRLTDDSGYSLVEVMASIMILTVAIIPMVGMFDMGLNAASTSGNYDTARALASKKLEQAQSLPYGQVNNNFPFTPPTANQTNGTTTAPITNAAPPDGVPAGFSYTVRKRFLSMAAGGAADQKTLTPNASGDTTNTGLIEVTVTVAWDGNSYTTTGVVASNAP